LSDLVIYVFVINFSALLGFLFCCSLFFSVERWKFNVLLWMCKEARCK